MNWQNVRLIFVREVRDQLRDRRTLFMIFVLPVLLYPLLGMSAFQVAQFVRAHPTKVLVIGAGQLPSEPRLFEGSRFAPELLGATAGRAADRESPAELVELEFAGSEPGQPFAGEDPQQVARRVLDEQRYEAVLIFPNDFADRIREYRDTLQRRAGPGATAPKAFPELRIVHNTAREKSQITYLRVREMLDRWTRRVAQANLDSAQAHINLAEVIEPVKVESLDVADAGHRDAALWSKVFPFVLLLWALTGAFYPAVDLCAGEKERGTLETLLSSPAERGEIVWGKLLTIMAFSMATVTFNLASLALTGTFVLRQLPQFGPPPALSLVCMLLAVVPVSALFSALCLALAAFARSTKEGQYYLMPLVLVTMPLVMLPMAPGFELTLGNSLIPLTGMVLLLRTMIEGGYGQALPYVPVVLGVTAICCWWATGWAIDQFKKESVLFREGERFHLAAWLGHLLRDRQDTPSAAMALFGGVLVLLVRFFMSFAMPRPEDQRELIVLLVVTQLVVILTPVLLMSIMLTRRPAVTLRLSWPHWSALPGAVLLAFFLQPGANLLQTVVLRLYPINDALTRELSQLFSQPGSTPLLLVAIAVVPAICEELAFRGFILSGFRHLGHRWRAIFLASLFFGLSHTVFQQSIVAAVLGMVLGYLAVRTGSIFPPIAFHMTHNALALVPTRVTPELADRYPVLGYIFRLPLEADRLAYQTPIVVVGLIGAAVVLWRISELPLAVSPEEALEEAIEHQDAAGAWSG